MKKKRRKSNDFIEIQQDELHLYIIVTFVLYNLPSEIFNNSLSRVG
jgi:hypothetical protein